MALDKLMEINPSTTVSEIRSNILKHAHLVPLKMIETSPEKEPKNVKEAISTAVTAYFMSLSETYKKDRQAMDKIRKAGRMMQRKGFTASEAENMEADIESELSKAKAGMAHSVISELVLSYEKNPNDVSVPKVKDIAAEAVNMLYTLSETSALPYVVFYSFLFDIHNQCAEVAIAVQQGYAERLKIMREKVQIIPVDNMEKNNDTIH